MADTLPLAEQIVDAIVADLNDRRGFHLDTVRPDVLAEMRATWMQATDAALKPLHKEVTRLGAECEKLRTLLRQLEWCIYTITSAYDEAQVCPLCASDQVAGHLRDCKLRAALDRGK